MTEITVRIASSFQEAVQKIINQGTPFTRTAEVNFFQGPEGGMENKVVLAARSENPEDGERAIDRALSVLKQHDPTMRTWFAWPGVVVIDPPSEEAIQGLQTQ